MISLINGAIFCIGLNGTTTRLFPLLPGYHLIKCYMVNNLHLYPQYIVGTSLVEAVDVELNSREHILQVLRNKLPKAQDNMKQYADRHRIPHTFQVGDWVFFKIRPYWKTSVVGHRMNKLSKRYYGPCHNASHTQLDLPEETLNNQPIIQPLSILDWKDSTEDVDTSPME